MHLRLIAVAAATVLASPASAASVFNGTWKGDAAAAQYARQPYVYLLKNGKFSYGSCVPKIDGIAADGKPHAVVGDPYADALAVTVVNPTTVKRVSTKTGKPMDERTSRVSADGKTMTVDSDDVLSGRKSKFIARKQ